MFSPCLELFEFQREKFVVNLEISGKLLKVMKLELDFGMTSLKVIDSVFLSTLNQDDILLRKDCI